MPNEQTVYTYQVVGKIFKKTGDMAGELRFSFQSTNDLAAQTMCKAFETFFNNNGTKSNLRIIREVPVKTE